jgi:hypothetical protein
MKPVVIRRRRTAWTYTATLPSDQFYMYTNSGAPGQWEGLDVPHRRV